jgi:hypothetical protein
MSNQLSQFDIDKVLDEMLNQTQIQSDFQMNSNVKENLDELNNVKPLNQESSISINESQNIKQKNENFRGINQLWKIVKIKGGPGRRYLSIQLCRECQNTLYNDKTKFTVSEEKIKLKITLCYGCAMRNICATSEYISKYPRTLKNIKEEGDTSNNNQI